MDGTAGAASGAGQVERPESEEKNSMEGKKLGNKGYYVVGRPAPVFES